jgi:hypothetical protein
LRLRKRFLHKKTIFFFAKYGLHIVHPILINIQFAYLILI